MNARYGFTRFEKRAGGTFQTLAVNARGYVDGQPMTMTAEVNGDAIIVWIDGEPVFAAVDPAILSGTVALYCQDRAKFDNVLITENPLQPMVAISSPLPIQLTRDRHSFRQAVVLNMPTGGNVVFSLDGGSETDASVSGNFYSAQFFQCADGEHEIVAILKDADGLEVSSTSIRRWDWRRLLYRRGRQHHQRCG